MVIEGNFLSESWGLWIDRKNLLAKEFPPDWVDPTKD
jgi:hypothetical protein